MSSFEKINYKIRPAKSIERKMLCDSFLRLSNFYQVNSYMYVGFGSPYFSDFMLVHKQLNIRNMVSIEKEEGKRNRFIFNRPFKCIELKFDLASDALPTIDWSNPAIVWLDYDGCLDAQVLADIKILISSLENGSVFVISVNSHPVTAIPIEVPVIERQQYRRNKLVERIGDINKIPDGLNARDFVDWGVARVDRRIIANEIEETLNERNGVIDDDDNKIHFRQLYNFHYSDGPKMLSYGGIIYNQSSVQKLYQSDFESLDFVRTGDEPYQIEVPSLTFREIKHLDRQLPVDDVDSLRVPSVPRDDIEKYMKVYRFFPTFTEADI